MGTKVRSEISKRKDYWLPKHRHLELVHFCLQYQEWKMQLKYLDGHSSGKKTDDVRLSKTGYLESPVEIVVERRIELEERLMMIETAAKDAASELSSYLMMGVTEGCGYDDLNIPCCKDVYYRLYRKFFWLLDKTRN